MDSEKIPQITKEAREFISNTPELQSLLYDMDLLPEQLMSQDKITPGLFKAHHIFSLIVGHFMAFEKRLSAPAAINGELLSALKDCRKTAFGYASVLHREEELLDEFRLYDNAITKAEQAGDGWMGADNLGRVER